MNPEYKTYGVMRGATMTPRRMAGLQAIVRQKPAPRGTYTRRLQDMARVELLAHSMGRNTKRGRSR